MKVEFLFVGKTSEKYLQSGIDLYIKRINHYLPAAVIEIPSIIKSGSRERALDKESEMIGKKISAKDFVVVLDENGKEFSSVQLSAFMNKSMVNSTSKIIFIVGGAYGIPESISRRANLVLSFSKFTMTHQMIRIFLLEQIYRAMTILNNEPYHHA